MRLAFAGTPTFAATVLAGILQRNFSVVSVLTQPDSLSGRGMKASASPVKQLAIERNIAVQQPPSLKSAEAQEAIARLGIDLLVVVAYGLILPPAVLSLPKLGCLNVHASLLPRWRGAAPIQRAIMAGDHETGVCIMRMDAGLDTGPVYTCRRTPIAPGETAATLHDRLADLGTEALCATLDQLAQGTAVACAQPADGITYAAKILKPDAQIDWSHPALVIERQLRALDPVPGAQTTLDGQPLKIWRGHVVQEFDADAPPGTVLGVGPEGIDVCCGSAALRITQLQRAGGRRLPSTEFLRGFRVTPGATLGG